jgi:hypothetical protein
MTHVLTVETRELSHPVILIILMKAVDHPNHESYTRFQIIEEVSRWRILRQYTNAVPKRYGGRAWWSSGRVSSETDDPTPLMT